MVNLDDLRRTTGARCKLIAGSRWYAACSDGSVWTRRRSSRNKAAQWMRLSESVGSHGYRCVKVCERTMCVHIVVLTAFRGPPKHKQEARHYDGDKLNNALSNLLWGTSSENKLDNVRLGRHGFKCHLGDTHPAAKLRSPDVVAMRALHKQGRSINSLAAQFGVTSTAASCAIKGRTWSHV